MPPPPIPFFYAILFRSFFFRLCSNVATMKFFSVLSILLTLTVASTIKEDKRQLNGFLASLAGTLGVQQSFDYIVLGGGTAGLTIAKRLAEDKSVTVAVIEAGTLYQVAAPVLTTTPAGDVTFVGMLC
jgi:hypothetical protein